MIDDALAQLLTTASRLPAAQVTPSTELRPTTQQLPRVAYTLVDDPPQYTDGGVMALRRANYQLDIFADSLSAARGVQLKITARADAEAAYRGLDGYAGTVSQTIIQRIYFGSNHVADGVPVPGKNQAIARCIVELIVVYRELLTQPNFTA